MTNDRSATRKLPNIFPELGAAARFVVLGDFMEGGVQQPSSDAWNAECDVLVRHGLAGVALRLIRDHSLDIPPKTFAQLQQSHFHDMATTVMVVKQSHAGIGMLRAAGIPCVVTKGPGIARANRAAADRPYMDLDVVVQPARFTEALHILRSHDYKERVETIPTWDSFNRFCREAVNLRNGLGGSIDLHHRVAPWYWSKGLGFDVLMGGAREADVFGVRLPLASSEHNLLVAALHIVSDKSRPGQNIRAWRDLLVLTAQAEPGTVVEVAEATGLSAWLEWILGCLPTEAQPVRIRDGLDACSHRLKGTFRLRMLLPPRTGSQHLLGYVFRIPAPEAALFTAGMVVPSPAYLRILYPERSHRYVAWWLASIGNFRGETRDHAPSAMARTDPAPESE